jgi:hypothetical protein
MVAPTVHLIAKANKIVADYYGEVLPDARRKVA